MTPLRMPVHARVSAAAAAAVCGSFLTAQGWLLTALYKHGTGPTHAYYSHRFMAITKLRIQGAT